MNPESTPYATYYELKTAAKRYIGALKLGICKAISKKLQNEINN